MIIKIENINLTFGDKQIFSKDKIVINKGDKIALMGANGSGKSSLLKLLLKQELSGEYSSKNNLKIVHIEQEVTNDNITIKDFILNKLLLNNDQKQEYEINSVLNKMNLLDSSKKINSLSGGELKRLQLSSAILQESDILLLDEPTNHLDLSMICWLENYLITKVKTFILISHDRRIIRNTANIFWEISHQTIFEYATEYESFLELSAQQDINVASEKRKIASQYKREKKWMAQGAKARSTKSRKRQEDFMSVENSFESFRKNEKNFIIASTYTRLGNEIVSIDNLSISYASKKIIANFNFNLQKYERIGLIGLNGSGKTSIILTILKELKPKEGLIKIGKTVTIGYFSQQYLFENEDLHIYDYLTTFAEEINLNHEFFSITKVLEYFKFPKNIHSRKISNLSGGEKKRLFLITILMKKPNLLIMDEPTNDLDIETIYLLEDYLENFIGSVILISHDRDLLSSICDRFIYIYPDNTSYKISNEFDKKLLTLKTKNPEVTNSNIKSQETKTKKLTYAQQLDFPKIETEIEEIETEIEKLNSLIIQAKLYPEIETLTKQISNLQTKLDQNYEKYEKYLSLM